MKHFNQRHRYSRNILATHRYIDVDIISPAHTSISTNTQYIISFIYSTFNFSSDELSDFAAALKVSFA